MHLGSHDLLKVWEITADISEMVKIEISYYVRLIGSHMCPVKIAPISMILSDLECDFSSF